MRSASEFDFRLDLYAKAWIEERLWVTRELGQRSLPVSDRLACTICACRAGGSGRRSRCSAASLGCRTWRPIDRAARALARSVRRLRELDVSAKALTEMRPSDLRTKQAALVVARAMRRQRGELAANKKKKIARV